MNDDLALADQLPLGGIRVLDLAGPPGAYCGRLLADLGADVVKVETPGGDELRQRPPFAERWPEPQSLSFAYYHANKRGICLDIESAGSLPTLAELGACADVVIVTPSELHPVAGFDGESRSLSWANRNAVVCCITPFGLTGPYRRWRATHFISCALGGAMFTKGFSGGPPQVVPGQQLHDHVGTHSAVAILAALRHRHASGGQLIDMSIHEVISHSLFDLSQYTAAAVISQRGDRAPGGFIGVWRCADGPIELAVSSNKQWHGLLKVLGDPPELANPAWSNPLIRQEHSAEIMAALVPAIATLDREDFIQAGQRRGVPCGLVNTVGQFVSDPQPRSRGFFVPVQVGDVGTFDMPGMPFRSSATLLMQYRRPAPVKGQDEPAEIVKEWRKPPAAHAWPQPLANMRVLSFGIAIVGALGAMALAELGADVVKIESPAHPDNLRGISLPGEPVVTEPSGADTCPMFANCNRSVRSLALDMKEPGSIELFMRLLAAADVVLENFGPDTLERMGLRYEDLAKVNPKIVMISMSGFGQPPGPRAHYRAYGSTAWSFSGMEAACGYSNGTHFDYIAEAHGVLAILAGLAARDKTGLGTRIDLALAETAGVVIAPLVLDYTVNGREPSPTVNRVSGALLSVVVPCAGHDRWLAVELEDSQDWSVLARMVDGPDMPAEAAQLESARQHLGEALTGWAASLTPHQAMRRLQAEGIAAAAVQDTEDVFRDVQHRSRGFLAEMMHPDLGRLEFAAPPHRLTLTPPSIRRPTPRLGEHTVEVLTQWLGMTPEHAQRYMWPAAPA
jgi:crotonobetainyl-CoA:carnitine CoA-transferase CaiB-like acyl-CoA transferase